MNEGGEGTESKRRGAFRWRRLALALLLLLLVGLTTAWLQRRTIARGFVDRELARRGVPARYEIAQLSPWRQRLINVSIGDPRNPDLTADWIELRTAILPWRAELLVAKVGTLRMNGRLVNGTLSLGTLDRLMPAPSGKPFALPKLSVDVTDAQLQLSTDVGRVVLALRGKGLLTDGFTGTMQARADMLRDPACAANGVTAQMQLRIRRGAPSLTGPASAAQITCGDTRLSQPRIDLRLVLDASLAKWSGSAGMALATLHTAFGTARDLNGTLAFAGNRTRTTGMVALRSGALAAAQGGAASAAISGNFALGDATAFQGRVTVRDAALSRPLLDRIALPQGVGQGTPIAPLAAHLASALRAAGRGFAGSADIDLRGQALRLKQLDFASRSGGTLRFGGGTGVQLSNGDVDLSGKLTLGGGGLPDIAVQLARAPGSAEWRGTGRMLPYAAGGAHMALSQLDFRVNGATGQLQTIATLSGPLGDGRIDDLSMPLLARWDRGTLAVNPACQTLRFTRIATAGMVLHRGALPLCPIGPAMVQWRANGLAGGIRTGAIDLDGTLGASSLRLSATASKLDLATRRFALTKVAVRTGFALDIAALDGGFDGGGFEGLGGKIGAVPLVLSQGKGRWAFADGDLSLNGGFLVSDAEPTARFEPLSAPGATLRLHEGAIAVQADLVGTKRTVPVGNVAITHDLETSTGNALLTIPGIRFRIDGLQPNDLTPLTFGVIADVDGVVAGTGRFAWTADAVTSSGSFTATDMALAAAFGPVTGLTTRIDFDDLLNVHTAPGQLAQVAEINPGVPVRNGTVRYQLLDSRRVAVEGGRWPFAGGELVLDPTILDFNETVERRMTFHVKGVDAALFLKEMAFDNMDATGIFDGTLPMIFDASGGRIEGGELRARAGGHLAYVGEVSQQDLGTWGNMAFQALKSLDYQNLTIRMNGPLAGEMVTDIGFSGISQGKGTKSNFLIRRLARLPFVFNVRINAPFRQLLDTVQSWYDPQRLIERNLPALIEEQKRAEDAEKQTVQPPESAPGP